MVEFVLLPAAVCLAGVTGRFVDESDAIGAETGSFFSISPYKARSLLHSLPGWK